MPAEKAGKDQKFLYGFSHFEYENTDPVVCYALHSEKVLPLTKAYILSRVERKRKCQLVVKQIINHGKEKRVWRGEH